MNKEDAADLYEDLLYSFTGRIAAMSDEELLAKAVAFDVGPEAFINGHRTVEKDGTFYFEEAPDQKVKQGQRVDVRWTGSKWIISNGHSYLNKDGQWEYPSIPSEQEDEFKERTRWDTPREAIQFFQRHRRWEWEIHDQLNLSGRELWDEMEKRLQERYKSQG